MTYKGQEVDIYVAQGQFPEVVFPESTRAVLPESSEIKHFQAPDFDDRYFFRVPDSMFVGRALVHGESGMSYHLRLIGRQGCADGTVVLNHPPAGDGRGPGGRRSLIEYLMDDDERAPGYEVTQVSGSLEQRKVFKQGSITAHLAEVHTGGNYKGYILHLINHGDAPVKFMLENIDFSDPRLRDALGQVIEQSMEPFDFTLDPAPQFALDRHWAGNQGIWYIVSRPEEQ